jgi:hypothetical protein
MTPLNSSSGAVGTPVSLKMRSRSRDAMPGWWMATMARFSVASAAYTGIARSA